MAAQARLRRGRGQSSRNQCPSCNPDVLADHLEGATPSAQSGQSSTPASFRRTQSSRRPQSFDMQDVEAEEEAGEVEGINPYEEYAEEGDDEDEAGG